MSKKVHASLWSSYSNLSTAAVGVGILSYPFAFKSAGILATIICTFVFAILNAYTLQILVDFSERYKTHWKLKTYEEITKAVLGKKYYIASVAFILFTVIGALTGFLIVLCDLTVPVLQYWLTNSSLPNSTDDTTGDNYDGVHFIATRPFIILVFGFCFVFPLSLLKNLHSLLISSLLAVASVIAVSGVVIYRGAEYFSNYGSAAFDSLELIITPSFSIVLALPLCIFALGCHLQVIPLYTELEDDVRLGFPKVIVGTISSCGFLYLVTGFFGYSQFGSNVNSDVLTNYPLSDIAIDVAKLLIGIHITLAYPVCLYPGRKAIDQLVMQFTNGRAETTLLRTCILNALIIISTGLLAIWVPQVDMVFGFVGSTSTVCLNYIFPGVMLLQRATEVEQSYASKHQESTKPKLSSAEYDDRSPLLQGHSTNRTQPESSVLILNYQQQQGQQGQGQQGQPINSLRRTGSSLLLSSSTLSTSSFSSISSDSSLASVSSSSSGNEGIDPKAVYIGTIGKELLWMNPEWNDSNPDGVLKRQRWIRTERYKGYFLIIIGAVVGLIGTGVNLYQDIY